MATAFTFDYEVTPEIIADAAQASLEAIRSGPPRRSMRQAAIMFGILCLQVLVVLVLAMIENLPDGIIVAAAILAGIFAICSGLFLLSLAVHPVTRSRVERAVSRAYHDLDSPRIRWTMTETGFTIDSRTTRRSHMWSDVREAFVGRTSWVLAMDTSVRLLLPASALPDGAERFMLDRVSQAGGVVRMEQAEAARS